MLQGARDPRTNLYLHSGNGPSILRTSFDFQAMKQSNPLKSYTHLQLPINLKHFQRPLSEDRDCGRAQNSTLVSTLITFTLDS